MLIQASFNPVQTDEGFEVTIFGRVFEALNQSVSNSVLSIQVVNPQGTSVHVAIAYSGLDGSFQDTFLLPSTSLGGNYTTFLTADKPGYDTAHLTLVFALSSSDFLVQVSSAALSIEQGQSATVTLTVLALRSFNQVVNLTSIRDPGVDVRFTPSSIVPSGTAIVTVSVGYDARLGNQTIILLGVSGSITHQITLRLYVIGAVLQPTLLVFMFGVIISSTAAFIYWRRSQSNRRQREAVVEDLIKQASGDAGYVATARAIARLEELRALRKIDDGTYLRLKREYEKRLEKST